MRLNHSGRRGNGGDRRLAGIRPLTGWVHGFGHRSPWCSWCLGGVAEVFRFDVKTSPQRHRDAEKCRTSRTCAWRTRYPSGEYHNPGKHLIFLCELRASVVRPLFFGSTRPRRTAGKGGTRQCGHGGRHPRGLRDRDRGRWPAAGRFSRLGRRPRVKAIERRPTDSQDDTDEDKVVRLLHA